MKASKFLTCQVHNGVYWRGMVKTRNSQITDVKSHEPAEQANQKQVTIKTQGTTMWQATIQRDRRLKENPINLA